MCHCYNNNYNNNYSFFILICLQPFRKPHLYFILHTTDMFNQTTSHKTDCITLSKWSLCLAILYVYTFNLQNVLKAEGLWSRLIESSIRTARMYAFSHLSVHYACCCCWFRCSMYLLVCICVVCIVPFVAFAYVAFALSISLEVAVV